MKIGIFASVAGRNDSGPETYEVSLIRNIALIDSINEYHIFCFNKKAIEAIDIVQDNFIFHVLWPSIRPIAMIFSLNIALYIYKIDIFHSTFIPPLFAFKPHIMTMHGSDMFEHPEFFKKKVLIRLLVLLKAGLKYSSNIICVSHHVKNYMLDKLTLDKNKLTVIHHGVEPGFKAIDKNTVKNYLKDKYDIESGYILFVGKLVQGKNIDRLLKAYIEFIKTTEANIPLVLAGRAYEGMSDFDDEINNEKIKGMIIQLGHVPHADLPYLYNGALMFVFPSLWEGFGLPLIEAMACEVPIITSNVSCIPEITENSALLINPLEVSEIKEAMIALFQNEQLRIKLIQQSKERAKFFSWEKAAYKTLDVYKGLI